MWELSVAEQRYEAVRAVIADGETVTGVAARLGVARKTVHRWLAKYEAFGRRCICPGHMSASRPTPA
jgi:transposase